MRNLHDGYASKDMTTDDEDLVESAKAKAEFQREVFKVRDGRTLAADGTATALIAAAAGVATIANVFLRSVHAATLWLIGVLVCAAAAFVLGFIARRETPFRTDRLGAKLEKSAEVVSKIHGLRDVPPKIMYDEIFDTWHALTDSAEGREAMKRRWLGFTLLAVALEVVIFAVGVLVQGHV